MKCLGFLQKEITETSLEELRGENLENLLTKGMEVAGKDKIERVECRITFRTSSAVVIADESMIPDDYMVIKKSVDKTALKKAIEAGKQIDGAAIETRRHIQIK